MKNPFDTKYGVHVHLHDVTGDVERKKDLYTITQYMMERKKERKTDRHLRQ